MNLRFPPALHFRDYRIFWVGLFVSVIGSQMQLIAVNWHIFELLRGQTFTLTLFGRTIDLGAEALAAEIAQNRRYLRALDPSIKVGNFAYPFGYGSFGRKGQLKQAFQSCRSIVPGINSDTVDLQFLRAMPLIDHRIGRDEIERAFDQAQTYNGWLIFYTHDVAGRPSEYGCSPDLMNHALEAASHRRIPVLNMAEALLCAGV